MNNQLGSFEGRKVEAAAVKLSGSAESRVGSLDQDEEVYFVVKATVAKVTFGDVKETYTRLHTARANALVLLKPEDGERMLTEAQILADERFGIENLFAEASRAVGHDKDTGEITGGEGEGSSDEG